MKNKFRWQNEMAGSCKQTLHWHKKKCNRFKGKTTLLAAILIFFYPSQMYVDCFGSTSVSALYDNEIISEIQLNNDATSRKSAEEEIDNIILITKIKPGINASSPENLELSIRNSVKSEIETKQHLKPLSLLEVLKEISEPEIRKPLSADIISSNNFKKDSNDDIYFKQGALLLLTKAYNETNFEAEASANLSNQQEFNNKIAVVEVNGFDKNDTHQPDNKQSSINTSEETLTLANISVNLEQSKIIKLPTDSLFKKEYDTKVNAKTVQSQIKLFNKPNNYSLTGDTHLSLNSSEFLNNIFKDDILSVHLNETIEADLDLSIENNTKSYFEEISEENGNNTGENKHLEHVVIKKVLEGQLIYDKSYVTTIDPLQHSDPNNKTEKFNELLKSNELETEYTTLCTFCLYETEEISSTTTFMESTEYYQSTGTTEKFESNDFDKTFDFAQTKHQEETDGEVNSGGKKDDFFVGGADQQDQIKLLDIIKDPEELTKQILKGGHLKESVEILKNNSNFLKTNTNYKFINNIRGEDKPISSNYTELDKYIHINLTSAKQESSYNLAQTVQLGQNTDEREISKNSQSQETPLETSDFLQQGLANKDISNTIASHNQNLTAASKNYETDYVLDIIKNGKIKLADMDNHVKNLRTVGNQVFPDPFDDMAATLFEAYLPRDVGQTLNDNLADESTGIGKALPVSITGGSNNSTILIILGSGTIIIFIGISLAIILISFHRQHGSLDIEMQERSCGKDDLDEEDARTFDKLLDVELPPSLALALDESEECL